MNRRDALKALATMAGATGVTVTPVTSHDASGVEMAILRYDGVLSNDQCARLKAAWELACQGTSLERCKTIVMEQGINVEFVKRRT